AAVETEEDRHSRHHRHSHPTPLKKNHHHHHHHHHHEHDNHDAHVHKHKDKSSKSSRPSENINKPKGSPSNTLTVKHANPFTGLVSRDQSELNIHEATGSGGKSKSSSSKDKAPRKKSKHRSADVIFVSGDDPVRSSGGSGPGCPPYPHHSSHRILED